MRGARRDSNPLIARPALAAALRCVAQIAERCGFSEPTNFTAAFKKHFAVLPKQVRERKSNSERQPRSAKP